MKSLSKALGVGLGYLAAGPVGAILGYVAGKKMLPSESPEERGPILLSGLLGFTAVVLRAEGSPAAEKRRQSVRFLSRLLAFDPEDEEITSQLLDQLLAVELDVAAIGRTVNNHADAALRRHLLEILFTICRLHGPLKPWHLENLSRIASALKAVDRRQWQNLKARYQAPLPDLNTECCHALLGLPLDASAQELKAAYRRLAKTYHPDYSLQLDFEAQRRNADMMTLINAAYGTIRQAQISRELKK